MTTLKTAQNLKEIFEMSARFTDVSYANKPHIQEMGFCQLNFSYEGAAFFLTVGGLVAHISHVDTEKVIGSVTLDQTKFAIIHSLYEQVRGHICFRIKVSPYGDTVGFTAGYGVTSRLETHGFGVHGKCGGTFELFGISDSHKRYTCQKCSFQTVLPVEAKTIGEWWAWADWPGMNGIDKSRRLHE